MFIVEAFAEIYGDKPGTKCAGWQTVASASAVATAERIAQNHRADTGALVRCRRAPGHKPRANRNPETDNMKPNPSNDFHRRDADTITGLALSARAVQKDANACAWGERAIEQIKAGNFQTAINQLNAGLDETSNSQYHGRGPMLTHRRTPEKRAARC